MSTFNKTKTSLNQNDFPIKGNFAFPLAVLTPDGATYACPGMTLRDYFAGQAITGLFAHTAAHQVADENTMNVTDVIAKIAYGIADSMLAAREDQE